MSIIFHRLAYYILLLFSHILNFSASISLSLFIFILGILCGYYIIRRITDPFTDLASDEERRNKDAPRPCMQQISMRSFLNALFIKIHNDNPIVIIIYMYITNF